MTETRFDVTRKFVRVTGRRDNGMVEFEFSVGEPEVAVELIMPEAAFQSFCAEHHVIFLETPDAPRPQGDFAWNLHAATRQRFR